MLIAGWMNIVDSSKAVSGKREVVVIPVSAHRDTIRITNTTTEKSRNPTRNKKSRNLNLNPS